MTRYRSGKGFNQGEGHEMDGEFDLDRSNEHLDNDILEASDLANRFRNEHRNTEKSRYLSDIRNLLGGSQTFKPVSVTGTQPKATIINIETDNILSLEVQLQAEFINQPTNRPLPRANVQYGSRESQNQFQCDIRRGTCFIVPASFLRVDVTEPNGSAGVGPGPTGQGQMTIRGSVAVAGGVSKVTPLRFTDLAITAIGAGATSGKSEIPDFATSVRFERNPQTAPFVIQFLDRSFAIFYEESVAAGQPGGPFPLSGDIGFIQIVNGATAIANGRLIYDLDL